MWDIEALRKSEHGRETAGNAILHTLLRHAPIPDASHPSRPLPPMANIIMFRDAEGWMAMSGSSRTEGTPLEFDPRLPVGVGLISSCPTRMSDTQ